MKKIRGQIVYSHRDRLRRLSHINLATGCIEWESATTRGGYGLVFLLALAALSGCKATLPFESYHVPAKLLAVPGVTSHAVTRDGVLGHVDRPIVGYVELRDGRKFALWDQDHAYSDHFVRDCGVGDQGEVLAFVTMGKIDRVTNFYCTDEAKR